MKAKTEFQFSDNNKVHVVMLKKRNYWWLLLFLLLLLPLLLLIRVNKDVGFKTVNAQDLSILEGTDIRFMYPDKMLFDFKSSQFFTKDTIQLQGKTDDTGTVVFKDVSYTLFARLFHANDLYEVTATNNCFMGDSIQDKFFGLKYPEATLLKLSERSYDLEFTVVDSEDNQPLPKAKVIITGSNGKSIEKESDANGSLVFEKTAYCQNIVVVGSKYGYENDTISQSVSTLFPSPKERILKLKPIKKMIRFTVKDLVTNQVIPNANALLVLENSTVKVTTNTNGVGKGAFEDVHIIEKLHIKVSKTFYHDTITPTYLVEKYIKLSENERTIFMRPETKNLEFYNVDKKTGLRLVGVNNKISVNGKFVSNEMSNANGVFTLAGVLQTDVISIVSSKNGYVSNSTKVANKKYKNFDTQDKRTIPLGVKPPPPPPPPADEDEFDGKSGDLRINLQWKTLDDLDLIVIDPCGKKVWALALTQNCKGGVGTLDVDANTNRFSQSLWTKTPQENSFWEEPSLGKYTIKVQHCIKQDPDIPDPVKFNVTVIYKGKRSDYKGKVVENQTVFVTAYDVK